MGIQHSYTSGMIEVIVDGKTELKQDKRVESNHFIMVEGTWYLHFMPKNLVDANKMHRRGLITDTRRDELLAKRVKYQLVRHGLRDEDGYQRYLMPDPNGYVAVDPITAEFLEKPKAKTVTIPMSEGIRWGQKYPFMGPEWIKGYNLRSTVERKNALLKHPALEGLDNPYKRQTRGFTATALSVTMLAVAHNFYAIDYYLRAAEGINLAKDQHRSTRGRRRPSESRIEGISKPRDGRKAA